MMSWKNIVKLVKLQMWFRTVACIIQKIGKNKKITSIIACQR